MNVGTIDRILRALLGIALIAWPFAAGFQSTLWTVIAVILGVVMLAVALTRKCPIYSILGVSTCAK